MLDGFFGAGGPFSAIWYSVIQFLFPSTLIAMILDLLFPFFKLYLSQELFLCYSVCYRNLLLHLFAMNSLSYKHTYIYVCGISFLEHPLISCGYPFSFFLRVAKLHNHHSIASLQIYSFI